MRSSVFSKALVMGFCLALLFAAPSCSQSAEQTPPENGYKKGQPFNAISDTYQLSGVLRDPKYDTDSGSGYAVEFLKKESALPLSLDPQKGGFALNVDFGLDDGAARIEGVNMAYAPNNVGDEQYEAKIFVYFTLPKDKEFPKKGVFLAKQPDGAVLEFPVDLSGVEITEAL
jgi:hypothetical protein